MSRRRLIPALALLLGIPLVLILAGVAHEPVAQLLWYLIWYGGLVLKAIPQVAFWALLLLVAVSVAGASLLRRRLRLTIESTEEQELVSDRSQVRQLALAIRRAEEGEYFRWRLARHLGKLILELLGRRETFRADSSGRWSLAGTEDLPAEIRAYLEAGLGGGFFRPPSRAPRCRWLRGRRPKSALDIDLGTIVQFLEDQSEVSYDH